MFAQSFALRNELKKWKKLSLLLQICWVTLKFVFGAFAFVFCRGVGGIDNISYSVANNSVLSSVSSRPSKMQKG